MVNWIILVLQMSTVSFYDTKSKLLKPSLVSFIKFFSTWGSHQVPGEGYKSGTKKGSRCPDPHIKVLLLFCWVWIIAPSASLRRGYSETVIKGDRAGHSMSSSKHRGRQSLCHPYNISIPFFGQHYVLLFDQWQQYPCSGIPSLIDKVFWNTQS